ncbi:MAG: type 4a pilus biogenesis protein PilO [Armatimonadota bacterium]|nr:type 4a pilus biogenesis protein PilO [Armatimonadota bacterium]
MRGLSPRERIMVSLVIAAAIVTLFYLFVYTPQTAREQQLTATLQSRQTELDRLKTLAQTREQKEREFQALSERIRLVELKLPPEREIPRLIRQLQDVAASLGIKLTLLRPGPNQPGPSAAPAGTPAPAPGAPGEAQAAPARPGQPAAPPRYQLFRLDLAFDGTYADLMAFLGRLEDFPRFLVLTQVSIAPAELPRLRVTLAANTFVLPREAPTPP